MKAKFIGDPNDDFSGPKVLRHEGCAFPMGQFVGVSDALAEKLKGHSHFEVEEGEAEAYVAPEPVEPASPATKALDGDDDGKMGGSLNKAETIARLEALQAEHPEIEFDGRWGLPKLRGVLEAAEFEHGGD